MLQCNLFAKEAHLIHASISKPFYNLLFNLLVKVLEWTHLSAFDTSLEYLILRTLVFL